ncbi:MAG: glycoside hydrolase family 13 protein [Clostridia bacterium]|nr:glycoside hydrolase family 13 protein [Clostridia bacterium]
MTVYHNSFDAFYRSPFGSLPVNAQVRLRLSVGNEHIPSRIDLRIWDGAEHRYPMRSLGTHQGRQIFEVMISTPQVPGLVWYRFEMFDEDHSRAVYGAPADGTGCGIGVLGSEEGFQISVYSADFKTPVWMREGIMYQIMTDRFFHGKGTDALLSTKEDQGVIVHKDWYELPYLQISENSDNLANDFFGGNLEGIRQKLPYLYDLGVTVLYLNPIFHARSNHKYDTSDYMHIDPMFGDETAFKKLCSDAMKLGIRIILDGVFSHVGDDSVYFNRRGTHGEKIGATRDPKSPYLKWFTFHHWPDDYDCWWGFKTLPNVNEMDEDYRRYILNGKDAVVKHWLKAGASGWRLDVADELPMQFLRELRTEVKKTKPDAVIMGEVWEDASHKVAYNEMRSYVTGDTLDSVMNYPIRDALIRFLLGVQGAVSVAHDLSCLAQNYPNPFLYSLMNLMGSHDRPRIINVLAGRDGNDIPRSDRARLQLSQEERMLGMLREHLMLRFMMSVPGIPCIYYADETGLDGAADPYCRRTYPWGKEDTYLIEYYKNVIQMRKESQVLKTGFCYYFAPCEDVLCVLRYNMNGLDAFNTPADPACMLTCINRSSHPVDVFLPQDEVFGATQFRSDSGQIYLLNHGGFSIPVPGMMGITVTAIEF